MPLKLTTYHRGSEIPDSPGTNIFHSKELFQIYEETPGYIPLLIMASEDGRPAARPLAAIHKSICVFPPSLIRRCEVYGTGEYLTAEVDKERIFGEMLEHLTAEVLRGPPLIEFRNLENAMFGHKYFRSNKYSPVNWLRVRSSLCGTESAEQRFSPSCIRQIKEGLKNDASVDGAHTIEEIREFSNMLRHLYSSRIRKHFPNIIFSQHMDTRLIHSKQGEIFIVRYKGKVIGGSACIYPGNDAYLWFPGGARKIYVLQYPGILAVWKALQNAHQNGFRHMEFMDVGLPFKKHGYRDFVLRFGDKQSGTRRWFRLRWQWLNNLLIKIYA